MNQRRITTWLLTSFTLAGVPAAHAQLPPLVPQGGRDCAVCHTQWVEDFRQPQAVLLMDPPGEAFVSASANCLGCHDGSVGDSRRRVYVEHGHRTGVAPPAGMTVPDALPLSDGQLACRTCHTAHSGTGQDTLATVVFLRAPNDAGQLCMMCHEGYAGRPEVSFHPLGEMKPKLPDLLAAAGARAGAEGHTINCRTCHTPHGQAEDHLLLLPASDSRLCLGCHEQLTPELWRPGRDVPHPQNPLMTSPAQRDAIHALGTRTGPEGALICLSCHKIHEGKPETKLLAETLTDSGLCVRCHPGYEAMFGGEHDLRSSAPEAVNLRAQTASASGPCGACHSFHYFTREPSPSAADPSGLCVTCHRQGECAGEKSGQPVSHPIRPTPAIRAALGIAGSSGSQAGGLRDAVRMALYPAFNKPDGQTIACLTCHNPHETRHPQFLRKERDDLCVTCHGDHTLAGGVHDFSDDPTLTNARGATAADVGRCGFCHGVHDAEGPALWRATAEIPDGPDALCSACHRPEGLAGAHGFRALRHPTDASRLPQLLNELRSSSPVANPVPPAPFDAAVDRITCGACHNLHVGPEARLDLLRIAADQPQETLCATCHLQAATTPMSLHADRFTQSGDHAGEGGACTPCHAVHELPGMAAAGMWAAPLADGAEPSDVRRCLGCHGPGGSATRIEYVQHPPVALQSPPGAASLPLADPLGAGRITCTTCHLPHGRHPDGSLPGPDALAAATSAQLSSLRSMVRPFSGPNACTACHGFDGLRRFLYWHEPDKRGPETGR